MDGNLAEFHSNSSHCLLHGKTDKKATHPTLPIGWYQGYLKAHGVELNERMCDCASMVHLTTSNRISSGFFSD